MREKKIPWVIVVLFRAVLGVGIILFVNQLLDDRNISVAVAVNAFSALTAGILGIPGVCALYGILFYQIL